MSVRKKYRVQLQKPGIKWDFQYFQTRQQAEDYLEREFRRLEHDAHYRPQTATIERRQSEDGRGRPIWREIELIYNTPEPMDVSQRR